MWQQRSPRSVRRNTVVMRWCTRRLMPVEGSVAIHIRPAHSQASAPRGRVL